ncbi:glycosyltransferase family 2 protein [Aureisphaera galaxeae]|uniref:glycosyltransferase family 2 protein n=1 Tax=Aureisphaera galaxeae TaxID=1538023 RepID=UPI0023508826|nr:glycosyltransferase family 2 protein [Aureisphaera galaxeae]MDC8004465.1 glycosyltransferase family 2 protein [Aureisphaera galaxeae]
MYLLLAMLSVLIPTYNTNVLSLVENIHRQCLEAGHDFEIMVADDASTDQDVTEANQGIDQLTHCRLLRHERNLGRTATRDFLAKQAQFDWLLFLDADVMPKYPDFIKRFSLTQSQDSPIVFGGVAYRKEKPELQQILRWKYGSDREAKNVKERNKSPHFIISQNLLIKKDTFFEVNLVSENVYGLDNVVSYFIYKNGITVAHIDNPVYHLGLENTKTFIKKSIQSLETSLQFHREGNFPEDFRPVQKLYLKLKKWGLLGIFKGFIGAFEKRIEKNLYSNNPNLRWFDLYRLYHYTLLKEKLNA